MWKSKPPGTCCQNQTLYTKYKIVQSLKTSLFCPFKGVVISSIANLHLLYGIIYYPFNKEISKRKIKEGISTNFRHLPQLAEMSAATIFYLYTRPHSLKGALKCLFICWASMFIICFTLRYRNFVKNCCEDFDVPSTFNKGGYYNSLCLKDDLYLNNNSKLILSSNIISRTFERLIYTIPFQVLLILHILEKSSSFIVEKLFSSNRVSNLNSTPPSIMQFYTHMASGGLIHPSIIAGKVE